MYKAAHRRKPSRSAVNLQKFTRPVKKDLIWRFEKAEMAVLGILAFVFFFFPLAIFLSGLAAYLGFKYWKRSRG